MQHSRTGESTIPSCSSAHPLGIYCWWRQATLLIHPAAPLGICKSQVDHLSELWTLITVHVLLRIPHRTGTNPIATHRQAIEAISRLGSNSCPHAICAFCTAGDGDLDTARAAPTIDAPARLFVWVSWRTRGSRDAFRLCLLSCFNPRSH